MAAPDLAVFPQLTHPDTVEGLVLINIDPNAKGWMDWAAHKVWRGLRSGIQGGGTTSVTEQAQTFKEGVRGTETKLSCFAWSLSPQHLELVHLPLQLTGLTSSIPEMILGHLFSQVRGRGRQK